MSNSKRLWVCLLLTGNLHVSNLVVATGNVPTPLSSQTSDPKQDDKDGGDKDKDKDKKDKDDKDKKPKDDKPKDDKPKDDKNDDKPKDDPPKEDKPTEDKPEDKKPEDEKPKDEKPKDNDPNDNKDKKKDESNQDKGGDKDKGEDKAPNSGGQDSGSPEPDQNSGNDDKNKDDKGKDAAEKDKGEKGKGEKDKNEAKDKKPDAPNPAAPGQDDAPVEEDAPAQDATPAQDGAGAAQVEKAGVAPGENKVSPNPVGRTSSGEGRYFVGEVSVNDGSSLLIGGNRLTGGSRWLDVLRAGMWAEAHGHWENDVFVADDVNVLEEDWAYYRGPAAALGAGTQGTVEAWTADGEESFEGVRAIPDDGSAVRLVAYFDGASLVAVPPSFPPPPTGDAAGWLELKGYFDGEKVVWESAAPFP